MINEYLEILDSFGPWGAEHAARIFLRIIKRMSVAISYERHFLLINLIASTFVQIRVYCDYIFQKLKTEKERIEKYSTPKVKKLIELLQQFNPSTNDTKLVLDTNDNGSPNANISLRNQINLKSLDSIDFSQLKTKIENTIENVTNSDIPPVDVVQLTNSLNKLLINNKTTPSQASPNHSSRRRFRGRGGGFIRPPGFRRGNYYNHDSDSLCGIIFCDSKHVAEILFKLICELTRCESGLEYLNVQYTVDKTADSLATDKEADTEHKVQEEVLKKFRMHECNLLIGTSVLEEAIELPKCNLVIRWDIPNTYRSYVQCKGRARASLAYHILMVAPTNLFKDEFVNINLIEKKLHKHVCSASDNKDCDVEKSPDDVENGHSKINEEICATECCVVFTDDDTEQMKIQAELLLTENFKDMNMVTDAVIEKLAEYKEIEKVSCVFNI